MSQPETANYDEPLDKDADVYTIEEFREIVKEGGFIDYDGMGSPVKDRKSAYLDGDIPWLYPSTFELYLPKDATHIVWYNK